MSTQLNITLANSRIKAGETTTVTFAFNEAVTGFTRDDVVLSDANGTLGEPTTSDNGRTWTATFTPTANVEDSSNTISVNLAGVTNTAGTAGSGQASSTNYGIDTRRPTVVAITVADMHLGIGETTTVTFTFSEAVTDLVLNDLYYLYANWRVLSFSDPRPSGTSRTIWTATVAPFANGDCNIGVDMRTVTDLAGNAGLERTVTNASRVIVDLVRPTAASTNPITFADTDLGLGETTTVTFRFSEAISGFALDDIDLSQAHGTLGGLRSTSGDGSSGDTWTALFTPTANTTSLTNTLAINLSGVRDIAGNAGQGSVRSDNYTVKTQPPTATITLANSRIKAGETTAVTFTFSETVTGFTRDDVVLSDANGTLGEPTTSDNGRTWTATFTPTANVEDSSNTISVNLAGVTNTAGTAGSGQASSANYGIDTRRPTVVAITVADMHLGIGETTTVTFTFSEAVTDLVLNDLYSLYANWRVLSFSDPRPSGTSRTIWTATVAPFANGDCNIGVDMRTVTDLAGNAGLERTVTNASRVIVDLVRPTAASTNPITLADTDLGLGETTTVTFRFSEVISGFALDDIDLSQAHGTLSGLRSTSGDGSSGDTWTALFTPTANTTSLTNTLGINLAGVSDIAGNAGQGSVRSGNYIVKTQGLSATITLADTALAAGETTTVTFTFSETVTNFTRDDVVFDATTGTLGEPTTSDNGTTWTATFTPTANANGATNTIRVNLAGVNTAAGTAGTGTASSDNFIVDTTPPVINTATVNGDQLVLTYTEANTLDATALAGSAGFAVSSAAGTAITVSSAVVSATAKTVTLTLSRAVVQGEVVSVSYTKPATGAVVQDAAGNDAADFSSRAVTNNTPDTTPPQLITTGGGYQAPAISGYTGDLVLRFNDASNLNEDSARKPAAGDFTVLVDGVARTVTDVSVSAMASLITLSFATPVTHGQRVTVAYQDSTPTDTNGIQDTAGNLLTSIPTTAVLNALPDTTAPALSTATVNDNQLVLTYTDTSSLNGAALAGNAGFTVSSATGAAIAVDSAVVHATNKTVTLTLNRTVANGETVTISYAKPATGNGVQDTAHNNAADFSSRTVINTTPDTTPPEFSSATVRGNQLVLTYTEANTLDGAALAGNAGFAVSSAAGTAITVNSAVVSATAKTVTLTLSRAVAQGEAVSVSYTKPATGAVVQDAAGNDAADFSSRAVTNNTPDRTPPQLITTGDGYQVPAISGYTGDLVLRFNDASNLNEDPARKPAAGDFTVLVDDVARTVTGVSVSAIASLITLSFATPVTHGQRVTVAYQDSTPNDTNGIQDTAGNLLTSIPTTAVLNALPDTTAPALSTATVNDNQLVLTYTDTSSLNGAALAGNAGFTVSSATGAAITVDSAVVHATNKTVTLTLNRTVANGETVTISYAKPATGNGVQDTAHNNAADFSSRTVINTTPDTTPPEFSSATVRGNQLVISYTEANTLDATALAGNAGFAVSGAAGTAITVNSAVVSATDKTVTLTLSRAVVQGEVVSVSYTKPATGNGVQDAAHNNAADFSSRTVTNNTPATPAAPADTTPPEFSSATVRDNQLVISYTEANTLDATVLAGNAGFTVNSTAGTAITVSSARVNATAKTVTLTLSRAVVNGETVTVSYAKPATSNGVQDAAHNNAADFSSRTVTNTTPDTTPPVFSSATVTDNQLVISYTEANTLDATVLAGDAGFTVSSTAGTAITVSSARVNATTKTVTLTLSRSVANGETVTVSYAKPATSNGVQDAAHNNAADFSSRAVTNTTPDTTPPEFSSATVRDNLLVISYTEANTLDATALAGNAGFTVNSTTGTAITVSSASVDATAKTVTLTLSRAVVNGETVTISYAKPAAGNGVQDAAHNNAVDFSSRAVTNNTPATPTAPADTTPPEFSSATVRDNQLVISYTEANALDATALTGTAGFTVNSTTGTAITVTSAVVSATAKTVTLTLSRAVVNGETVTISYAKPATGNGVQDAAHNNAADFSSRAVTNTTPDTTPPEFSSATVRDSQLVISYTEANTLDATALAGNAGFTVNSTAGTAITVSSASVNATAKTVTLTLSRSVANGETVTVSYAKPATGNGVQDAAHNNAADFSGRAVTNTTPDTTPPVFSSATVRDNQLVISYTEANTLDATALAGNAGFTVSSTTGTAIAVSSASVNATAKTVTLTLSRAVTQAETVTVSYAKPATGNGVQDEAHNNATDFNSRAVTNTTPDTTPPVFSNATVTGNQLVISYTEANTLDATALTGNAGFAVSGAAGTAITVNSAAVNATAKTVTLTLSRAVAQGEAVSLSYTKPTTGAVVQDAAGNDAADFSSRAVTNNTPDRTPPQLITTGTSAPRALGSALMLEFSDMGNLDATEVRKPLSRDFTVLVDGTANAVTSVTVNANINLISLALTTPVRHGQSVSVAYSDSTPDDTSAIQDTAGNRLTSFPSTAVDNRALDRESPQLITTGAMRPSVNGNQLVLGFSDTSNLLADLAYKPATGDFTVLVAGLANAVTAVAVDDTTKTITLILTTAVTPGQTTTVAYTDSTPNDTSGIQDTKGNSLSRFAATEVNTAPDTTPPQLITTGDSRPRVTGNMLLIDFTDTSASISQVPSRWPVSGDFTVLVNGVANTVTEVFYTHAKTIAIVLTTPVRQGQTVTISYQDSTPSDDRGIQDTAGNRLTSIPTTEVNNKTDNTPPVINTATVNGNQLVLTYTEANRLDGAPLTGNAGFTVSSTTGTAITVSDAVAHAANKTVTLTLSRAVTNAETVTVSYTKPESGAVVRDAAGNTAANLSSQAVTNNTPATPATPADTTPPEFSSATVTDNQLVISYTEANSLNAAALTGNAGFTVSGTTGTAIAVSSASVDATAKTVTLTLSRAVAYSETVNVSYTKPTTGAVVQDAAGNAAANFSSQAAINNTQDTTPPVFSSATVTDNLLVISYTEANHLDAAALTGNAGFTVSSTAGTAITVSSARVNTTAKTVTLTLNRAVANSETVNVSYTKPASGNGIRDTAGNDAANFSEKTVAHGTPTPTPTDTTPPALDSATVNGNQLVLTYTEAGTLDVAALVGNAGFTVSSSNTRAITVTGAVVDATTKTVTLTLSRSVTYSETVSVSYTKPPTGHGVQDAAGNAAADFSLWHVRNNTPVPADTTPPVLSSATVNGNQLVLTYTETTSLDAAALTGAAGFTVSGYGTADGTSPIPYGVFSAVVNAVAKTVTLTLRSPVGHGQRVIVSYTQPTTGHVVQDAAGNEAANLRDQAVTNNTSAAADTTPPVFRSATVNGDQLVLRYTEANNLEGAAHEGSAGFAVSSAAGAAITVTGIVVNATTNTVTLKLSRAVTRAELLTVSYTQPGAENAVQDAAGNAAANFGNEAVSNDTPIPETTPPVLGDVTVNGNLLELSYTDANKLDINHTAPASAFALSSSSDTAIHVSSVAVTAKTVTLTLSRAVASDEKLTLSYTKPAAGDNVIQDAAGNDAASFGNQAVENLTPAPTPTPEHDPGAPIPEHDLGAPDADHDGMPDAQEDQAIGPRGAFHGDGNGDDIQDSAQAAVASFRAETSSRSSGTSVTLVADSRNGMVSPGSNTRITSLEQKAVPAQTTKALETPIALTSFKATLETAGSSKTFSLFVDSALGVNGYWLQDHGGTWVNLASSPYGGKMVDEAWLLRLDFSITDGGPFDADGKVDGVITAPGAAGYMPLSIVGQAPDGAPGGFWL
ncbi:hypothetical protein D8B24_16690 [Verminephrobacter aporrectodeae subsp. tuberculatae]|uniref:SwmB domain-containing protein n=4 Tax=Verminephrobacter aporrectodeae TaxID=1110389 RepID=UPI0022446C95|nr:SwmB domain-containing protein [Verminephrobacter aporrectodeae]MCW8208621.1 hypothetical protein [Verminephrobacter aporrectodeae subsp. tuberculatae]